MSTQLIICIVVFVAMIIGFVQSKVSRTVVALAAMMVLVMTKCLDAETALSGFANDNIILMGSMFIIAEGFSRTQAVSKIAAMVGRISKGSFTVVLAGYVIMTMVLGQITGSSAAAFAIIYPMLFAVCDELGFTRSKMLFAIGMVAISTCAILPIGGSAVAYAQNNAILESLGAPERMTMLDPMIARLPSLIASCLIAIFIIPRTSPELPAVVADVDKGKGGKERKALSPIQEKIGYITFFAVVIIMLFSGYIGIENWEITVIGALIICATRVLSAKEAYSAATMGGIIMMYVGVIGVSNALTATGAGEVIGNIVSKVVGGTTNGYIIGLVFFLAPFILTQVMNNRAVASIFSPIAIMACQSIGCNPVGPLMLVTAGALTALMTPMATATVNMVMGLGGYSQKHLIQMSIIPSIILTVVNVLWIMTIYPAY